MCIFFTFTALGEDIKNIFMSLPYLLRISGKSLGLSLHIYYGGKVSILVFVSMVRLRAKSLDLSHDKETGEKKIPVSVSRL